MLGAIAFAGSFTIDQSVGLKNADETQLHFFRLLAPGAEDRSMLGSLLSGDYHYRGTLREASHDLGDDGFRERARSHLKGSGWIALLE